MSQTRFTLILAWLMVATLLWIEWGKDHAPKPAVAAATVAAPVLGPPGVPGAPATTGVPSQGTSVVSVRTDVLAIELDGGTLRQADLLRYPRMLGGTEPTRLFSSAGADYYVAQSGWQAQAGGVGPGASGFVPQDPAHGPYVLAAGSDTLDVPFQWSAPNGVRINRMYHFTRGSYAVTVTDTVANGSDAAWQGYVFRQLARVQPVMQTGFLHPESYSFVGSTWFNQDGYHRRAFKDYLSDGPVNASAQGGWLAMPQHHFIAVWIPQADQSSLYSLGASGTANTIAATGPSFTLQPGQQAATRATLWVGPKDVHALNALNVPGLGRAVDYSRFSLFAILGQGLFWLLSQVHAFIGNWGWAIVAVTCLLKLVLFPLSNAQYKSAAQMRRVQPRIKALQERYADDKQKLQMAMMELYRTEKINPMGGCLSILPQTILFMTFYWVLSEAVELRHAPWIGWIHDLTARDPYFVLPVLNAALMIGTQHMMPPPPGMDPTQQKMMKFMPIAFGFMLAFMPAGLVLYQVTNGALTLLQQWYMLRKHGGADASPGTHVVKKKG